MPWGEQHAVRRRNLTSAVGAPHMFLRIPLESNVALQGFAPVRSSGGEPPSPHTILDAADDESAAVS